MLGRNILSDAMSMLDSFPVVALLGPRQVGKTTMAHAIAETLGNDRVRYLDLESPADRSRLTDPEAYLATQRNRLVILDEIHRVPELFSVLRGIVDRRRRAGRRTGQFLVLGSASFDLLRQSSESLAGRIAFIELTPVRVDEVDGNSIPIDQLWLRGGFPDSLLARSDAASLVWRKEFIRTYLERDIPQFGPRIPAETLRRFWTMLAHTQGELFNAARLAGSLGISGQTVARYLDLLVDLLLVRRLQPWSGNQGKRLVKSPKTYIRDSGLVHALMDLKTVNDVLGHPVAGTSWEGMAIESLIGVAGDVAAHFYRSSAGAEIDLVLENANQRYAIEIKRSSAPGVTRGFWTACDDLNVEGAIVVYPGEEQIPIGRGVLAMGHADAANWIRKRFGHR